MRNNIRRIINVICILILIFCGYKIISKQIKYVNADSTNSKIQKIVTVNENAQNELNAEQKLKNINSDYKFWIKIPGTNVNYPVVQTDNNEYYLHHNFEKQKSIEGTLFLYDKYNKNTSRNTLVFGHNMRNNTMFGSLWPYKDKKFFDTNKDIYIMENGYIYTYEIFGDAVVHAYNPYLKTNFKNQAEFVKYIDDFKEHAYFFRNVPITDNTKILTLSTCSYEFDNARFVIISKFISKEKINNETIKIIKSPGVVSTKVKIINMLEQYELLIVISAFALIILLFILFKIFKGKKRGKH